MEHAIRHAINVKMKSNPVHYTSLYERLTKIIEETNMNWEERRRQLEEFIEREMGHGEEDLAKKMGLKDKRQLAIFETVCDAMDKHKVAEEVKYYGGKSREDVIKNITLSIEEVIVDSRVKGFVHNPTRIAVCDSLKLTHCNS